MESTTFFCKKKGQTIDIPICISRQNKKLCICSQGREVTAAKKINRTRTKK